MAQAEGRRVDLPDAVVVDHQHHVDGVGELEHGGRVVALEAGHDDLAGAGPGDEAGGQVAPHQRARDQAATQLGEGEHGVGPPQAHAALGLGEPQGEHAHLGQLAPQGAVDAAAALEVAHGLDREPALAERAHALGEGDLVVGELEVHLVTGPWGGRGSARR